MRVILNYSDGRYSFSRYDDLGPRRKFEVDVPESTVLLWQAIQQLDHEMQRQMLAFDNDRILDDEAYQVIEGTEKGKRVVFEGAKDDCIAEAMRLRWKDKESGGTEAIGWWTEPKNQDPNIAE